MICYSYFITASASADGFTLVKYVIIIIIIIIIIISTHAILLVLLFPQIKSQLFSSVSLLFPFSSFPGHLLGFISIRKVFANIPRIVKFFTMKLGCEEDFHCNDLVKVNLPWFFSSFFPGLFDWIAFNWVWFERSRTSARVTYQSYLWPLKCGDVTSCTTDVVLRASRLLKLPKLCPSTYVC